ncbi:MAG: hypothetical protein K9G24_06765 [Candidatus Nanopelagicales bacterium]|nr:hypothetical protein [Candidatus Nanopelagicales bacterium]MCF8537791.1 hypothetical protein [Candidatus Nanopelagicales bacterium]MCF8542766.1 hypothetical protein [Candidatus Nanopelagicales bacterium]MCF8557219.1 hypothetical protein [Candidatus Nanopelagicales bacterium]
MSVALQGPGEPIVDARVLGMRGSPMQRDVLLLDETIDACSRAMDIASRRTSQSLATTDLPDFVDQVKAILAEVEVEA